jgi:hypothetical protein
MSTCLNNGVFIYRSRRFVEDGISEKVQSSCRAFLKCTSSAYQSYSLQEECLVAGILPDFLFRVPALL